MVARRPWAPRALPGHARRSSFLLCSHASRAASSLMLARTQQKGKAVRAGSGKTPKNGKAKREAAVDSDNDEFEEVRESQWLGKALRRKKTQEVAATGLRPAPPASTYHPPAPAHLPPCVLLRPAPAPALCANRVLRWHRCAGSSRTHARTRTHTHTHRPWRKRKRRVKRRAARNRLGHSCQAVSVPSVSVQKHGKDRSVQLSRSLSLSHSLSLKCSTGGREAGEGERW